jgi:hypothetical protein
MSAQTTDCQSTRQALRDLTLAGRTAGDPPQTAAEHLRTCTACEDYRRGLSSAPAVFADGRPLYSAWLRRRTLAAVAAADEERATGLLPLLVPAAVASVAASLIGPVWVVTRLVEPLIESSWVALGIAVLLCSSFGLAALVPGLIALMKQRDGAQGITLHNG